MYINYIEQQSRVNTTINVRYRGVTFYDGLEYIVGTTRSIKMSEL